MAAIRTRMDRNKEFSRLKAKLAVDTSIADCAVFFRHRVIRDTGPQVRFDRLYDQTSRFASTNFYALRNAMARPPRPSMG